MEQALLDRIASTLRELGAGFTFVGRQVHFDVNGRDFYIDLLFFHVGQLRYVVVELKKGEFEPAFTGQLGFYIVLVDDRLRRPAHAPTVGILICGDKDDHIVRYTLSQAASPIAVATYTYKSLPPEERLALPDERSIIAALETAPANRTDVHSLWDISCHTKLSNETLDNSGGAIERNDLRS